MLELIKDIINGTLKNKDNKFSSKKIMSCVAYNSAVLMCWIDMLTKKVYSADINTIILLLSIAGYSSTLTVYSNKKT